MSDKIGATSMNRTPVTRAVETKVRLGPDLGLITKLVILSFGSEMKGTL